MAGIPIDTILGAIPNDLKPQGFQNLPQLIMNQGIKIDTLVKPSLEQIKNNLPLEDICLTEAQTEIILLQRDNLVGVLNNVGVQLDQLSRLLGLTGGFLTVANIILKALVAADPILSATGKAFPVTAGITESIRSDLKTLKEGVLFDEAGESRITPIAQAIASSAISVSIVNSFIKISVDLLNSIDQYLIKCSDKNLSPLSATIEGIVALEDNALQTSNQATYKGFIIQIEEEPFTSTVNRRKAVGLNQYGIKQIETQLSFTTNPQTLINELKFIIDRDNLKAD